MNRILPGLPLTADHLRKLVALVVMCAATAVLVVDWDLSPAEVLVAGEPAPRTVKASRAFDWTDVDEHGRLQEAARAAVPVVFSYDARIASAAQRRIHEAFARGRDALDVALATAEIGDPAELPPPTRRLIRAAFRSALGVDDTRLAEQDISNLVIAGFPERAEALAVELQANAMGGYVVESRTALPVGIPVTVIDAATGDERPMDDTSTAHALEEARRVDLGVAVAKMGSVPWVEAAATVAASAVVPNLVRDAVETTRRREVAAAEVPPVEVTIKRGTTLFRDGEVLTESHVRKYEALRETSGHSVLLEIVSVFLFVLTLSIALYQFGATWLPDFSTRLRDAVAVGSLVVFSAVLARVVVLASGPISAGIGWECQPQSVWYVVPIAGVAMLVRLLVGIGWSIVFAVAASAICGLVMDLQALNVVFFLVSSMAAAGAVEHTRERMAVLRAGLFAGVLNAALVLLIHFLLLYVGSGAVGQEVNMRPVWSVLFAFVGGLLSAFLVLGVMPLFETLGFVTDYRLMELANLNHPLMRQLMLRAPGTYHHSVIVGSLADAACEAIGANALQAKVAAYFHDIGKANKPHYFVENQKRNSVNRHNNLDPTTSAQIIIAHVTEGGRMAKKYRLPQPIIDNIYMHHGTGLLQYFYTKAREMAEDPDSVDESKFRYTGPRPDTREAGVIMLADKVEAATRTIQEPDADNIRAMINRIINSVMADGQFAQCPLTFQELYAIADSFVNVLLGIHHQRIEYSSTASISRGTTPRPALAREAVITLELPGTEGAAEEADERTQPIRRDVVGMAQAREAGSSVDDDTNHDYESIEHLPRGRG